MRKPGALFLVVAVFALTVAGANAGVWTDQEVYFPGETVSISGDDMEPGESVLVEVFWPDGSLAQARQVNADEQGAFSDGFTLPGVDAPVEGHYTVVATGQTSGEVFTTTFFDPVDVADITIKADDCATNQASFNLGDTVCASVDWETGTGMGNRTFKVRWFAPGTFPAGSPVREVAFTKVASSDGTETDSFVPTSAGTWTVHTCRSASPADACNRDLDSQTFTVTAAPSDTTDPVIDCDAPDTTPWYNVDVQVPCTATDADSPPATPAAFTLSTTGEGAALFTDDQEVCDSATTPNCVTAGPFGPYMVDKTAPSINCTVPNQAIWYAANVTVPCTAIDALSGLADAGDATFNLVTSVADGAENASANTDTRNVLDNAGNSSTAGPYSFMVDRKGPTVTCDSPEPVFILNQAGATVSATVTDGGSGAAASPVSVSADTSLPGTQTVAITGLDNVGNSTTVNCTYHVQYIFTGFLNPITNTDNGEWNIGKAGRTFPMKWQLTDANGAYIGDLGAITSYKAVQVTCDANALDGDPILDDPASNAGSSQLRYDETADQFIYNWQTSKNWANKCFEFRLALADGTTHKALFMFTK